MGYSLQSFDEVVEEIMKIHRSLPTRPGIDEFEAAKSLIQNVEKEDQLRLDAISRQRKSPEVPEELFFVLQEMQKNLVYFQSKDQKTESLNLLDLENVHVLFDEFVQRASKCLPSSPNFNHADYSNSSISTTSSCLSVTTAPPSLSTSEKESVRNSSELFTIDDAYVKKAKATFYVDGIRVGSVSSSRPQILDPSLKPASQDGEKLSLIKLASLIEVSSKKGTEDLNLQNKLMDHIEWLPDSIGKLSGLITLDLSDNQIVALPKTVGGLLSLTRLDLHSNRIVELPESIGNLLNLVYLDLSSNQLMSLPVTLGKLARLEELNLSLNRLTLLPESIGNLICLKKLNVETNNIEEIPHTIGQCSSLIELCADYNRLKALPEAVGRVESLEILSVRYNNIKQLPTTMASLPNLKEIDVSFNELEGVPENLCLATTLVKLNVGNNFADLRSLPRSIGNLEMLEELDISNNQIRVLPDSFRMLSRLRLLRVEENPLNVPPRHITKKGAQAVVRYMAELVAMRDTKSQQVEQKTIWSNLCFFSRSHKRKHDRLEELSAF